MACLLEVGVTKPISSIPLISSFGNDKINAYLLKIILSYLTGVTAAELWWHLTNMSMIQRMKVILLTELKSSMMEILTNGALVTPTPGSVPVWVAWCPCVRGSCLFVPVVMVRMPWRPSLRYGRPNGLALSWRSAHLTGTFYRNDAQYTSWILWKRLLFTSIYIRTQTTCLMMM